MKVYAGTFYANVNDGELGLEFWMHWKGAEYQEPASPTCNSTSREA